jgi:hypothetical protein
MKTCKTEKEWDWKRSGMQTQEEMGYEEEQEEMEEEDEEDGGDDNKKGSTARGD